MNDLTFWKHGIQTREWPLLTRNNREDAAPSQATSPIRQRRRSTWGIRGCILLYLSATPCIGNTETQIIDQAILSGMTGTHIVHLPHVLTQKDFPAQGGLVSYRLEVALSAPPEEPLGIFVPKLSLSGQLTINGTRIGACGIGLLKNLRCLHQPQLFVPPDTLWHTGINTVEFDIYANDRQMNGLSPLQIGPARTLYEGTYLWRWLWQVELLRGMTWVAVCLGALSLAVGWIIRSEKLYLWFGLAALTNAASNLNILITTPPFSFELFSWIVFSSRLITTPLGIGMLLSFFGRASPAIERLLMICVVLMPAITWLSDNNRWVVAALYLPMLVSMMMLSLFMLRWTWGARHTAHITVTALTLGLMAVSIHDWLRLNGQSAFEGVYGITYAFTGFMLVFGLMLISRLASALIAERQLSISLNLATRASKSGLWDWKLSTNEVSWSQSMLELFGINPGGFGKNFDSWAAWRSKVHPEDLAKAETLALAAARERKPLSLGYRIVDPDGSVRWIETRADINRNQAGVATSLSGISLDVTTRMQAEIELDRYRQELEERVRVRTNQIKNLMQESHDQRIIVEREQARQSERQHLLQEMHDGFGSQLATARLLMEQGQISQAECTQLLGECLDDLRLIADTLSATGSTLIKALANYRYRCQNRLAHVHARVDWQLELAGTPPLSERVILQILRILQEALANALKHSHAQHIGIDFRYENSHLLMKISDDGVGIPEAMTYGRGLSHMESRARSIGAQLEFVRLRPGTRIAFNLPLIPA